MKKTNVKDVKENDGLCAFLCRNYCIAKKGYDPKNCPIKEAHDKALEGEE